MKLVLFLISFVALGVGAHAEELPKPAEIRSSYGYMGLGLGPAPLPLPIFSGGWRMQQGHHGLDLSLDLTTVVTATAIQENVVYLHYFKPNLNSQFYLGWGIGVAELFGDTEIHVCVAPEFLLGKQYINEAGDTRFCQAKVEWPVIPVSEPNQVVKYPIVTFSYGFCF